MVRKCKVCNRKSELTVILFSFPKNENEKREWAKFCNLPPEAIKQSDTLCNLHFDSTAFKCAPVKGKSNLLKSNAIPTIFETPGSDLSISTDPKKQNEGNNTNETHQIDHDHTESTTNHISAQRIPIILSETIKMNESVAKKIKFEPKSDDPSTVTSASYKRLKFVRIEQVKSKPIENVISNEHQSDKHSTNLCSKCIDLDVKLQQANRRINVMGEQIAKLKAKLINLKSTERDYQQNDASILRPMQIKKVTMCDLCKVYLKQDELQNHLCLKQDKITCEFCSESFKTTIKCLDHLSKPDHVEKIQKNRKEKIFFKCDLCSLAYPMQILLDCHKISHIRIPYHVRMIPNQTIENASIAKSTTKFYKCGKCEKCFDSLAELVKHMRQYRCNLDLNNGIFQCYLCKLMFNEWKKLRNHMDEKHPNQNKNCTICQKQLTSKELQTHLCCNEKYIKCEYCDAQFTVTIQLIEHLEESHEQRKLYRCHECNVFLPMMILNNFHMPHHVGGPKWFTCDKCSMTFSTEMDLSDHKHMMHKRKRRSNENQERPHMCDECGKCFVHAFNLKNHKLIHVEPTLQCPDCPMKFRFEGKLKRHRQRHKAVTYVCEICNIELRSKHGYDLHKAIHTRTDADRTFECKICSKKFFTKKSLSRHNQVVHKTRDRVACQYCNVTYKYQGDLNKHLRIMHSLDGKIYECDKCSIRFYYPTDLEKHSLEHYKEEKVKIENASKL